MGTEIISKENFHCLVILRDYAAFPFIPCPDLLFNKSDYGKGELTASPSYPYMYNGDFFHVCENYMFIFFI